MTITSNKLSDFYIILSKGYFAPQILENSVPFTEPFQSSFDLFNNEILSHKDDLPEYLGSSNSPFWEKSLFIPNVGEVTYNHRKNVISRLLLGGSTDEMDDYTDYKFTYPSSIELHNVLHLPLLIGYQKKVETNPLLSSYMVNGYNKDKNKKESPISQQCRTHIHFYPYGLCFVYLAISINSLESISIDNLISWVRDLKATSPHQATQVVIPSDNLSFNSIEQFFDYIWGQISKKILKGGDTQSRTTPIYDSIRIKPLQKINEVDVKELIRINKDEVITENNLESFHKFWFADNEIKFEDLYVKLKHTQSHFKNNPSLIPEPPNYDNFPLVIEEDGWFTDNNDCLELGEEGSWFIDDNCLEPPEEDSEFADDACSEVTGEDDDLIDDYFSVPNNEEGSAINTYYTKMLTDVILQKLRNQFPIKLSPKEIAGLLSKSPDWRNHRASQSEYESVYGIYEGDLILPKSQSTLLITNVWSRRKQLQLLFQWELSAISELAYGEKLIISYYLEHLEILRNNNDSKNPVSSPKLIKSVATFLYSLMRINRHLPPHFRKWYHILAETIGLDRRQEELHQYLNLHNLGEKIDGIKQGQTILNQIQINGSVSESNIIIGNENKVQNLKKEK